MNFLCRGRGKATAGPTAGEAPRPIVGDYEVSWVERETPSFFRRLRRVLG